MEKELADKKELNTVYFEGNPLQTKSPALYRNKVRLALPQINQIDASMSSLLSSCIRVSCSIEHQHSQQYSVCPFSIDANLRIILHPFWFHQIFPGQSSIMFAPPIKSRATCPGTSPGIRHTIDKPWSIFHDWWSVTVSS